jgi:hypothetical protein
VGADAPEPGADRVGAIRLSRTGPAPERGVDRDRRGGPASAPAAHSGRISRAADPRVGRADAHARLGPALADVVVGDIDRALWILLAAAALVLAIAGANCANLLLVRAESRREIAVVKRALGATLNALVIESLAEGLLIASVAGALALVGTMAIIQVVRWLGTVTDLPRTAELNIDAMVIAVAGLCTMGTAMAVTTAPALRLVQHARSSISAASPDPRSIVDAIVCVKYSSSARWRLPSFCSSARG